MPVIAHPKVGLRQQRAPHISNRRYDLSLVICSDRFLKQLRAEWRGEEVGGTHGEEVGATINLPRDEREKLGEDSAREGEGEKLRLLCFPQMTKGGMMGDLLVSYDAAVSAARAAEQRVERQEARARDIETRHTPLTHRALLNPLNPNFQPDYKAAWDSLSPDDRKEVSSTYPILRVCVCVCVCVCVFALYMYIFTPLTHCMHTYTRCTHTNVRVHTHTHKNARTHTHTRIDDAQS